jgi:hypothetical protein
MCLNVAYYGQANGTPVVQAACSNGTNERWLTWPAQPGYFWLYAYHSHKCADKAADGNVVQWTCQNAWWQKWKVADTGIPTA